MSATLHPQPLAHSSHPDRLADHPLRHRLAGLRRRLRLVASFRGISWLVACLLATIFVTGLVDYRLHLPGLARAFVLTGLLAGCGLIVQRFLVRPLSIPADDLSLALQIEERYPLLNDGLASTVQFLERTPPEGESESMRREAVRRTLTRLEGMDFNRVVDARGLRTAGASALFALLATLAVALPFPGLYGTALARIASPFGSIDWPRKTRIDLGKVAQRIGRNREYRLVGTLEGVIPREVTAEIIHEGFPVQRKVFAVHPEDHRFSMHLKPEEVLRSFRFRILANDAATPEIPVEVLPLPGLVSFDGRPSPQVRIDVPLYTDLPTPQHLQPGTGNLDVVAGSLVTLRAAVDRPLQRTWIEYQPELQGTIPAAILAPLATQSPLGVLGSLTLSRGIYERIPGRLSGGGKRLEVAFRPSVNGSYVLHFEDEHGLENSRAYELRLRLDPAPVVRLERPAPSRDVLNVLPTAELPLHIVVEDSQYAVRSAWLDYRTQPDETPREILLYHHARGLGRDLAPLAGLGVVAAPTPRLRLRRLEFQRRLPMRSLRHADGSMLKEGDVLVLQARADDFDDVSVGKEPGQSHQVTIRIVGRDALEVELNREQGRIQNELVQLRDKEREALAKMKEIEARMRKGGKMVPEREATEAEAQAQKLQQEAAEEDEKADRASTEEERRMRRQLARELREKAKAIEQKAQDLKRQATQLAEAEQIQQQVREKIGNDREGLRAEVERLRETLRQNGLQNSNAMERMSQVARELDRLTEKELDQIEPKLTNARKLAELEDEKTRQERRADLEQRARSADREALAAEERAARINDRASAAEKAGEQAGDTAEKARKKEEARRLRQQAQEERRKAAERRAQAERDRRDAQETPNPERARQALAEARRGQEEVERSLSSLLQDLEPWSSTLEVNSEAGRLLQEQKDLQAALEERDQKGLTGKSRDELTDAEKAELDADQDTQRRLQERAANLLTQMKRLAEAREEKDPEMARDLRQAAENAESSDLRGHMKAAQEHIARNELNKARQRQRRAAAELEKLLKSLKDSREARLDRLGRKVREAEQKVEELMDEQEKLQRKIREAGKIDDPKKREAELARLARRQKELQKQADDLTKQLSRLGHDRARQSLQEARKDMDDAARQLSRGTRDNEKQDDVLDRLEETRRELERTRKRTEEELGREQLVRVADVLRRIRDRQDGHVQEAKRIQDEVLRNKGWKRGLRRSMDDLGRNQAGLAEETAAVARKELSSAPVYGRLVERAARAMEKAGSRASALARESPELEKLPDAEMSREQGQALRRLEQLLASLKDAADEPRPLSRSGTGGADEEGASGGQGDDSLPPLAQLKLLRSLQKEVNDRTEKFRKAHADLEVLDARARAELQEIRREQKEVADLLERYTRPAEEPDPEPMPDKAEKEGEKK